jgi:hypothetical protein
MSKAAEKAFERSVELHQTAQARRGVTDAV